MRPIQTITNQAFQEFTVPTDDGQVISIEMKFYPRINGWYISKLEYNDFILTNVRVVSGINMLRQFKNLIPFGIGCVTEQKREPMFIDDFASGASTLYYLSKEECDQYEDYLIESKV